jgi:hypothetical protein
MVKGNPPKGNAYHRRGCKVKGEEAKGGRLEVEGEMTNGNELVGCIGLISFIGYIRKSKCQMTKVKG